MNAHERYTELTGLVVFRNKAGRMLSHRVRPDVIKTVCGRYKIENLDPALNPGDGVPECGMCIYADENRKVAS